MLIVIYKPIMLSVVMLGVVVVIVVAPLEERESVCVCADECVGTRPKKRVFRTCEREKEREGENVREMSVLSVGALYQSSPYV